MTRELAPADFAAACRRRERLCVAPYGAVQLLLVAVVVFASVRAGLEGFFYSLGVLIAGLPLSLPLFQLRRGRTPWSPGGYVKVSNGEFFITLGPLATHFPLGEVCELTQYCDDDESDALLVELRLRSGTLLRIPASTDGWFFVLGQLKQHAEARKINV